MTVSIFSALLTELTPEGRDIVLRATRTPDPVSELDDTEVFVFGSNAEGKHGGGAAAAAAEHFGAVWGEGHGLHGQSYAIDSMSGPDVLADEVSTFLTFAQDNPDRIFLLTPIGTGIAGFAAEEVAPLFEDAPANVILPVPFAEILNP